MKKVIITIRDEVNCKIKGLDLDTRRKLVNQFSYDIPHARHTPAFKLGRWNGKVSFFQLGGGTYINLLEEIIPVLVQEGYDIDLDDQRNYRIDFTFPEVTTDTFKHITWPEGHQIAGQPIIMREHQVGAINDYFKNPQSLQEIATGAGKCQPLDSKIKTPTGWTTMGEIKPGDYVTIPDGSSAKVQNVYDPGEKDVYEITFSDGRIARSCEDHIWPIYNIGWRSNTRAGGPVRNLPLKDIIKLKETTKRSIGIPLGSFEHDRENVSLPMDPWLMGFLLGDGSFRNSLSFSSADDELVEKVAKILPNEYKIKHLGNYDYGIVFTNTTIRNKRKSEYLTTVNRNSQGRISLEQRGSYHKFNSILIEENLFNKKSHEKFIPEKYFNSNYKQRQELIRGLVDSDGTIDNGSIVFTSVSEQLALDFQRLVRSVGGIAKISKKENCTYVYKGQRRPCRESYTVRTKIKEPWNFVTLERKKNATGYSYQYGPTLKLNIEKIEKVSYEPVKCIMIDHPDHLYVTDDYIVTHNTIITAALSYHIEPYGRSVIIVPNKSLVEQTEEDYINMGLDVGVFYGNRKEYTKTHTICTWQSLNSLFKKSKTGEAPIPMSEFLEDVVCVIVDECFDGDTLITTPDGKVKIKDLKSGDTVINLCEETKQYKEDTIVKVHQNLTNSDSEDMLELKFDNNAVIKVTANHKILTDQGWVRADELTIEMEIVDINTYS